MADCECTTDEALTQLVGADISETMVVLAANVRTRRTQLGLHPALYESVFQRFEADNDDNGHVSVMLLSEMAMVLDATVGQLLAPGAFDPCKPQRPRCHAAQ